VELVKPVRVTYGILGRTALGIDDDLDEVWGTPRLRGVLATLLVHQGRTVSVDTLLAWCWAEGEATPQNPMGTFYTYATRIRGFLRRLAGSSALHIENGGYRLVVEKNSIDYGVFRVLIGQARELARSQDFYDAARCAERALGLWRGRALDDLMSEPAEAWRTRVLRDEWVPANVIHIESLLGLGEFEEALTRIDELRSDYDRDVTIAKLRLSALQRLARYSDATAYYLAMRRLFLDEADDQAAANLREHYDGLRASFAQSTSQAASEPVMIPRQLPHDIGEFIGRVDLVKALDAAMRSDSENLSSVVVIDGMAGVGKTALAVHWAHRVRHLFPDGDFFVNLNGFSDSASLANSVVVDELLIAFGHPLNSNLPPRSKELLLKRLLADRRVLIVLDNARSADHVKDLIALLSNCSIVVTSRQRLTKLITGTGVRRVHVDPLNAPEAVEMLSTQLGDRNRVGLGNWQHLAALCGGLPLVITVLAQHIASQSVAHLDVLSERLDRRQLLIEIGEDGDESASAETFFLWSYHALPLAEQRLFRLLGLNPGYDISEDAARACDGRSSVEVRRGLRILVAAHLLEQPDAFDRYRFHDLIREFALRRVEMDESPETRRNCENRLLDFYLAVVIRAHRTLYPGSLIADQIPGEAVVETVEFVDGGRAKAWFDRERINLVAIINLAAGHGYHEHAWRLTDMVSTFLDRQGYYEESRKVRELSVASARAVGDRVGEASTLVGLGMVQIILGDHDNARNNLESALRIVAADGNERGQAAALHNLGRLELMRGNPRAAVDFLRRCLKIAQQILDSEVLCWTHCRIAEALRGMGEQEEALTHLYQGKLHAERVGDDSALATSMVEIGFIYHDRGEHDAAVAHCEGALKVVEEMPIPDLEIMTSACIAIAEINHELANVEVATQYVLRAIELATDTHNAALEAQAQDVYGDIQSASGESSAAAAWQYAADMYERLGNVGRAVAVRQKEQQRTTRE
jgi:tetratricopeptide (TPR) repeat protein